MRTIASTAVVALLASPAWTMQFPDCIHGPELLTTNPVCNTTASPADRAKAIVAAMNINEKLVNMVEYLSLLQIVPADSNPSLVMLGSAAIRMVERSSAWRCLLARREFCRIGNFSYATSFASPILLSATFDDEMIEEIGTVISNEARAFSNAGKAGLDFWYVSPPLIRRLNALFK